MKLIVLHHRLSGFAGHRYNEGLALIEECRRRGWQLDLLVSTQAGAPVLQGLGGVARAVFNDPTFDFTRNFQERVDDFASQLRAHVEPGIERDCRVLVTVATQCEACALARWAKTLPAERVPWFLILFLSDRWNRDGARPDEAAEIEIAAGEFAALDPATRERFVLCGLTGALATELTRRLRQPVSPVPAHSDYHGLEAIARARRERAIPHPPKIALLGGARSEKGSHRTPETVAACRTRTSVNFIIQAHNETLEPVAFERLRALGATPGVTMIEGSLDRDAYERVLAVADALFQPYERKNYRKRNSGIFCEGVAAGLPSIVPSGTWLAEQIESGDAVGVVYEGEGAQIEAEAVKRCVDNLEALTVAAGTTAAPWRERQSLTASLNAMERVRAARSQ